MSAWQDLDYEFFYDFCLDWQMGYITHEDLKYVFVQYGWEFEEFKQRAIKHNYWVASMSVLGE